MSDLTTQYPQVYCLLEDVNNIMLLTNELNTYWIEEMDKSHLLELQMASSHVYQQLFDKLQDIQKHIKIEEIDDDKILPEQTGT